MHIISKEYHKEKNITETLQLLIEKCLLEWENLLQIRQILEEKNEADRVISEIAHFLSQDILQLRSYRTGSAIFFYGDKDEVVHFIIKGSVQLYIPKTQSEMRAEGEFNKRMQICSATPQSISEINQSENTGDDSKMHSPMKLNDNKLNGGRLKLPVTDENANTTRKKWSSNNSSQTRYSPSNNTNNEAQFEVVLTAIQKMKGSHLELLKGNERVRRKYIDGSSKIAKVKKVSQVRAKQSFGELSMVLEKPRAYTAIVSEEAFIVTFSSKTYRRALGEHFAYVNAKYVFLNKYFALSIRKETLFHLGVLFDHEGFYNLGDMLFREGEQCLHVYLLKKGKIEFQQRLQVDKKKKQNSKRQQNLQERQDAEAHEGQGDKQKDNQAKEMGKEVSLGIIQQGEFFGFEDLLIGQGKGYSHFSQNVQNNLRTYSAKVISSDAIVYAIDRAAFLRVLQSNSVLDQEIKGKALVKIQYHQQRINELKRFEEAQSRIISQSRAIIGSSELILKRSQIKTATSSQISQPILLEMPFFDNKSSSSGRISEKNSPADKGSQNIMKINESVRAEIYNKEQKLLEQRQQLQTNQNTQEEQQQLQGQQLKQSLEPISNVEKAYIKDKLELAQFDIPKDISKGNVQFLRFNNNQFSDLKSMRQYYLDNEERAYQIKHSRHELNIQDETKKSLERLFCQTNSLAIKSFKNSYSKKLTPNLSLPGSRKETPIKVVLSKNDEIIVENKNEISNESQVLQQEKTMIKSQDKDQIEVISDTFSAQPQSPQPSSSLSLCLFIPKQSPSNSEELLLTPPPNNDSFTQDRFLNNRLNKNNNMYSNSKNLCIPASADKIISSQNVFHFPHDTNIHNRRLSVALSEVKQECSFENTHQRFSSSLPKAETPYGQSAKLYLQENSGFFAQTPVGQNNQDTFPKVILSQTTVGNNTKQDITPTQDTPKSIYLPISKSQNGRKSRRFNLSLTDNRSTFNHYQMKAAQNQNQGYLSGERVNFPISLNELNPDGSNSNTNTNHNNNITAKCSSPLASFCVSPHRNSKSQEIFTDTQNTSAHSKKINPIYFNQYLARSGNSIEIIAALRESLKTSRLLNNNSSNNNNNPISKEINTSVPPIKYSKPTALRKIKFPQTPEPSSSRNSSKFHNFQQQTTFQSTRQSFFQDKHKKILWNFQANFEPLSGQFEKSLETIESSQANLLSQKISKKPNSYFEHLYLSPRNKQLAFPLEFNQNM